MNKPSMNKTYDCIIVGGGHNGLVCAAYLARAGKQVLVLERSSVVGGACITEEIAPGYRASTASYLVSLLLPEVIRDLELPRYGYKVLGRNPSSFTPLPDGRYLMMGPDEALNHREIAKFSKRDAEAYPKYEAWLTRVAECIEPLLLEPPGDLTPLPASWRRRNWIEKLRELRRGRRLYKAMQSLGDELPQTIELMTGAARPILDRWFESDVLKATLATDAIIGAQQPISAPGTGYVLLHHVMGTAGGARGVWGYVEGGMGAITQAMAKSARDSGVEIRCDAVVAEILTEAGRATGVRLADGEVFKARTVASNADARVTFEKLLANGAAAAAIPCRRAAHRLRLGLAEDQSGDGCAAGFHLPAGPCGNRPAASRHDPHQPDARLPRTRLRRSASGPAITRADHRADHSDHGRSHAGAARPSHRHHVRAVRAVQAFRRPGLGSAAQSFRRSLHHGSRCLCAELRGLGAAPAGADAAGHRTPFCAHRRQHLPGLDGPAPVVLDAAGAGLGRLPLADQGLYLCGSATHPGGGVTGAPGRNCAIEMLRDL